MPHQPTFAELMTRLKQGDEEAARQIFEQFGRRLIGLANRRLQGRIRRKVDPEDVMQSVFKSFFVRHAQGQFQLENEDSLWAILTVITMRKCGHRLEYFHALCRTLNREDSPPAQIGESFGDCEALARVPTPAEAAMLAETVQQLMTGLDDKEQNIVSLRLQGYSIAEISQEIGRSERTVHRVMERCKKRLQNIMEQ